MPRRFARLAWIAAASWALATVSFSQDKDRRDASGLKLPFHMTTTAGGRIVDELILEQILVNPEISKSDFKR